ncbi:MAG: hypothetical protein ACYS21_15640, partial [Planctomycetota bacterium]|jgi:hypothetical protein
LLQRDVTYLCECQKDFERKLELLHEKSISHEYRLKALEKQAAEVGMTSDVFQQLLREGEIL